MQKIELRTICGSWFTGEFFLNYTFTHFSIIFITGLIPYLMSTETPKIQYQKEVEVRVESFGETRCMKPQKPETKIRMVNPKKYKERNRRNCLIGNRNPVGIWLMKVLQQSFWKTQSKEVKTLPKSSREFPTEPRAKVEPGSGKHRVFTHLPKDPDFDICLKTETTKVSCRRRAGTVVPRAITADHKFLVKKMNSMCSRGTRFGNSVVTILPV